jgi:hypothetical protein
MVSGEALAVEAAFYERHQSTGDHRAGRADGEPGGGGQSIRRLYCKLVAWLPRMEMSGQRARKELAGCCSLEQQRLLPHQVAEMTEARLFHRVCPGNSRAPHCARFQPLVSTGRHPSP